MPRPAASRPGHEHEPEHRAAEAGGLQQQERAEQRRAQQRADRREAAGRRHHRRRRRRRVARRELDGQHAEPAAHEDQRRLGAEHRAEGQRGQRGEHDAGELGRRQRPRRLEAVGGRVAAGPGQVADRECGEQPREREQRQRPPHRRRVEPEGLRQVGEDGLLQPVDEREEPVRGGGDGHARQARRARAAGRSCGSSAAPEGPAETRGPAPLESSPAARAGRHLHRVIRGSRRSGGMPPSPALSCRRAGDAPARAIAGPPAGWDGPPHDPPADRRRPRPHALRHRLR